jgi:hypothetical protein
LGSDDKTNASVLAYMARLTPLLQRFSVIVKFIDQSILWARATPMSERARN